jgi:hypothetical protein
MFRLICNRFHVLGMLALQGALLTACGGGGDKAADHTGDLDGGAQDGSMEVENPPLHAGKGEVALRVDQARRASRDGEVGDVHVAFTLANGDGSPPASLNLALFSVKTSAGLYVMASANTPSWVDGELCNPSVAVGAGASASCALSFELEADATPVELFYQTPGQIAGTGTDQRSATAALTLEPCTPCGADCTYVDRDSANCGTCGNSLDDGYDDQGNATYMNCVRGKPACPTSEHDYSLCIVHKDDPYVDGGVDVFNCTDFKTSLWHCGGCGKAVEHGECANGQPVCDDVEGAEYTMCGQESFCADLTQDVANCGSCGHSCEQAPGGRIENLSGCVLGEMGAAEAKCSAYVRFEAAAGDHIAEGDSCTKLCLAHGFETCTPGWEGCAQQADSYLSMACSCMW